MEDFRVKTSWRSSRKRRRLKRLLGADGVLAIEDLWSYCAAERESGDLSGLSNEDIADEVAWEGDADQLVSTLVDCGLLDGEPFAYRLHDWEDHNPYVATGEPRSEKAKYAAHCRWHEKQGKVEPDCKWCAGAPAPGTDALPEDTDRNASDANAYADASFSNAPSLPPANQSSSSGLMVDEVNGLLHEWARDRGWDSGNGIPPKHVPKYRSAAPFTPEELTYARGVAETRPGKPNPGLLLSIILTERSRPEVKSRGSPHRVAGRDLDAHNDGVLREFAEKAGLMEELNGQV